MVKCSAILLTAGKSTRMGSLKALLPWKGTTLLQHQLSQFHLSKVDQLIVVLGYQSTKLLPYLENVSAQLVWNEHYEMGKTESIKKGLLSLNEKTDCIMIASVDQPVSQALIDAMVTQFIETKSKIIIPVYNGKRGHPILFSSELLEELRQINEDTNGLKAIVHKRKQEISELTVEDRSVLFNFNSPKDYEAGILEGGSKRNESF
jgi:molybdenum cofactor cytidylyltransferase